MPLSAIALALSAALTPATAHAQKPIAAPIAHVETVKQQVQSYFADIPIMVKVAGCESHYRQFDVDGTVYRGEQNHLDVGVMQINQHYHLDEANTMGIDLNTIQGNMAYARHLYEQEGTAPWSSSEYCWNPDRPTVATTAK
jgi:hypothetical protein